MIIVLRSGPLTTVQDLGRPGYAHLGVGRAGAADTQSLRRANTLVGNPPGAAALEATLHGPLLRFDTPAVMAAAGGRTSGGEGPHQIAAGTVIDVGPVNPGVRAYIAIRGGVAVPPVLGSRSTDVRGGIGPPVLTDGASLSIGPPPTHVAVDPLPEPTALGAEASLRIRIGPRDNWLSPAALQLLTAATWTVTAASDRTGLRLSGPRLVLRNHDELPSEGLVAGAIQVPPDGAPIVMLAEHPTTGGYPVCAVVRFADLPIAAQLRPGSTLRLLRSSG